MTRLPRAKGKSEKRTITNLGGTVKAKLVSTAIKMLINTEDRRRFFRLREFWTQLISVEFAFM